MPLTETETTSEVSLEIVEANNRLSAQELLNSYNSASDSVSESKELMLDSCTRVIRCGALFAAKKEEIGHGKWEDWLEKYLPEVKLRTIQIYMQVAKAQKNALLKDKPRTIQQALVQIKKIVAPAGLSQRKRLDTQSKPLKSTNGNTQYLPLFHQLFAEKPIEALLSKKLEDFGDWSKNDLENLVSVLLPIAELRGKLTYWLDKKLREGTNDEETGF